MIPTQSCAKEFLFFTRVCGDLGTLVCESYKLFTSTNPDPYTSMEIVELK